MEAATTTAELEEVAWSVSSELLSWRLLAALEVCTLALVALALLLHAARARAPKTKRGLRGQHVLITKGDTQVGLELARQFKAEGCIVSLVTKHSHAFITNGARMLQCDARRSEDVRALAARLDTLDVLVICGAEPAQDGLDDLTKNVTEEVYSNFHMLEELEGRMRAGGRVAWVCAGEGRGPYAGAIRSLQQLARTLLEQVSKRSGCKAVWCELNCGPPSELAASVVRQVSHDSILPPSAEVFRDYALQGFHAAYKFFSRCSKIWT